MPLFYIIYKSTETRKMSISQIEDLANAASKKNLKLGVTGLLIKKKQGFIQYLEGDKTTIIMLYEEILRDKRHHSLAVLAKGHIPYRKFTKWSMLLKYVTKKEIQEIEMNRGKSPKFRKKKNWGSFDNLDIILELINSYKSHN